MESFITILDLIAVFVQRLFMPVLLSLACARYIYVSYKK